jgi:hypothetical protein
MKQQPEFPTALGHVITGPCGAEFLFAARDIQELLKLRPRDEPSLRALELAL